MRKAKETREQEFLDKYGLRTAAVIELLGEGYASEEIAILMDIKKMEAAGVFAHLTRGTYRPFFFVKKRRLKGNCA